MSSPPATRAQPDGEARDELARLARLEEYRVVPGPAESDIGGSAKLTLDLNGLTELARRLTGASLAGVNIIDGQFQVNPSSHTYFEP